MSQQESLRDRLVDEYLRNLVAATQGRDELERADTLDAVRRHIETVLPEHAPESQVRQVLTDLGEPSLIADSLAEAPRPGAPNGLPVAPAIALLLSLAAVTTVVIFPVLAIALAIASLAIAVVLLRRRAPWRLLTVAALVLSSTLIVGATLTAIFLLPVGADGSSVVVPS